jgi:hypothetical protein
MPAILPDLPGELASVQVAPLFGSQDTLSMPVIASPFALPSLKTQLARRNHLCSNSNIPEEKLNSTSP